MLHLELTRELDLHRMNVSATPEVSNGMAAVFEDTPQSLPVGIFTATFAQKFCKDTSGYVWRRL